MAIYCWRLHLKTLYRPLKNEVRMNWIVRWAMLSEFLGHFPDWTLTHPKCLYLGVNEFQIWLSCLPQLLSPASVSHSCSLPHGVLHRCARLTHFLAAQLLCFSHKCARLSSAINPLLSNYISSTASEVCSQKTFNLKNTKIISLSESFSI